MTDTLHDEVSPQGRQQPRWFTPHRLLVIFCFINFINYLDHGAIASNGVNGAPADAVCFKYGTCAHGSGIQREFGLSYFQDGVLSSMYTVGLLVASPIFAHLSKIANPFRLIGVGLSVWTFAAAGCGFSGGFWSIICFRMLLGVGEASFISVASPFILDVAPPSQSLAWLSVFYMSVPVGISMGYVYGGVVGGALDWRSAFWIESLLMLPFAIFGLLTGRIYMTGDLNEGEAISEVDLETPYIPIEDAILCKSLAGNCLKKKEKTRVFSKLQLSGLPGDCKALLLEKVYTTNILSFIVFNFVLGAYCYWGPKAGQAILKMEKADEIFGGIMMFSGVVGTLFGGLFLDYWGSTIRNAFKLLAVATTIGATGCFVAFVSGSVVIFVPSFAIGQFCLSAIQAPVNFVSLRSVHPSLMPLAMAMSKVSIHVFGEVPSAPIVGAYQDRVHNWRLTILLLTSLFYISAAIWGAGLLFLNLEKNKAEEVCSAGDQVNKSEQAPLLTALMEG